MKILHLYSHEEDISKSETLFEVVALCGKRLNVIDNWDERYVQAGDFYGHVWGKYARCEKCKELDRGRGVALKVGIL